MTQSEATSQDTVGRQAARGATWSGLAFALDKLVVFVATAILAHLLTPREFGIVAIAMVVIGYVERISEGGLEPAVITFPESDQTTINHAVGLSLGLGSLFALIGVATAPLVAMLFDEPDVTPVIAVLSILYLTTSMRKVFGGVLARRMQFGRRVIPELVRALIKAVIMISLAWMGFGVWALTLGHLIGGVVGVIGYVVAVGARFRPRISMSTTPALLRMGGSFSLISLLGTLVQNIDYVFLGIRANTAAVGLYSMGFRVPEFTVLALPVVASPALITAYTKVLDSADGLRAAYLQSLQLLSLALLPVGVGLSLVADDAVPVLFGDQWTESIPVVRLVGLMGIVAGLGFPLGDALKATERAMVLVKMAAVRLAFTVPILWWAAGLSLTAVAASQLALASAHLVAFAVVARWSLGSSIGAQFRALRPALISVVAMISCVLLVRWAIAPGLVRLIIATALGGTVYGAVLLVVDRRAVQRLSAFVPGMTGEDS